MSDTNYTPLTAVPGVCKVDSAYLNSIKLAYSATGLITGRFTDMQNAVFTAGMPEKIGGWTQAYSGQLSGTPRGLNNWRDNSAITYIGIGTTTKLYYYSPAFSSGGPVNITPWRSTVTGSLTNPFATSNGSNVVTLNWTGHGLKVGDYFMSTAATSASGISYNGTFFVATAATNSLTFLASGDATADETSDGGTVTINAYRITLTNPFSTVNGSPTVTVAHTGWGGLQGDTVDIAGASAVGGLTLSGAYVIQNASANTYTITAATNATSTVSGGGGSPNLQYEISIGASSSAASYGYGTGGYGQDAGGGYGTTSSIGTSLPARTWSLDNYGQQLIASPYGGTIYIWDPTIGGRAYPLYGAPTSCVAMFVTNERFVFALGTNGNFMQIMWPDQSNYNQWTSLPGNTADTRTVQKGSYLVGGCVLRDLVALVFTNTACIPFTYSGDAYVYDDTTAGIGCGLAGPLAQCVYGGIAYWMGINEFWNWNGAVAPLPSDDIRDYVFNNINLSQSQKFVAGVNAKKKQILFFYCSATATENDSFVIYHVDQQCFSIGLMSTTNTGYMTPRTSWLDRELFPYPLATDSNGYLYYHENGVDANGAAMDSWVYFAPMVIDKKGNRKMDIAGFKPDFERLVGAINLSVYTQNYPEETPSLDSGSPYTITAGSTNLVDIWTATRMAGYKLESNGLGYDWRIGLCEIDAQVGSSRR